MNNDYRNTEYCPVLEDVPEKKIKLQNEILLKHPRQRNMYNKIHLKDNEFNKKFNKIYNCKCAYCGVSMDILPSTLFEIDHYIAESLFIDKCDAGKIKNLVLSCYQCNRNKKDFVISDGYIEQLNTDNGKITEVFFRDEKYYIRIRNSFKTDNKIKEFYDKLKLCHQSHRIDYLLLKMNGLHSKIGDENKKEKLAEAILLLQRKRNKFGV